MSRPYLYLIVLLLFGLPAPAQVRFDSSYENSHYRKRMDLFRSLPRWTGGITFLGNSITEVGPWSELLPGKKLRNRGISGDVVYGVLARIDSVLLDQPRKLFLLIGVNDLKRGVPPDTVAAVYRRLVTRIRSGSPRTKLYVQSVLPVNEGMLADIYKKITNNAVRRLNEQLQAIAREYGCTYVDIHAALAGPDGQLPRECSTDGLHLSIPGYVRWAHYLQQQKHL